MKKLFLNSKNFLLVALMLLSYLITNAQNGEKVNLGPVTLTSSQNQRTAQRSPIAFKEIPMKDEKGNAINPETDMTTPDGQKMKAKEYFAELNKLEKELNAKGYSLTSEEVIVESANIPKAVLDEQIATMPKSNKFTSKVDSKMQFDKNLTAENKVLKPMGYLTESEFKEVQNSQKRLNVDEKGQVTLTTASSQKLRTGATTPQTNATLAHEINREKTQEWKFGTNDKFQAKLITRFYLNGKFYDPPADLNTLTQSQVLQAYANTPSEMNIGATATTSGSIFGRDVNIMEANTNLSCPADLNKNMNLSAKVVVLNQTVLNFNQNYIQAANKSNNFSIYKDFAADFETVIYGIPVTGNVGARGKVGFEYNFDFKRTNVHGDIKPYAELAGYASVGVGNRALSAGVEGSLTFIKGGVEATADAGVYFNNNVIVSENFNVNYDLEMLKGGISLYIKNKKKKLWEKELWTSSGYKAQGTLVNQQLSRTFDW